MRPFSVSSRSAVSFGALALLLGFSASHAYGAEKQPKAVPAAAVDLGAGKLVRSSLKKEQNDGLAWHPEKPVELKAEALGEETRTLAILKGAYANRNDHSLLYLRKLVQRDGKSGEFTLVIPVTREVTEVKLISVGPKGTVQEEKISVYAPGFQEFKKNALSQPTKKFYASVGLGVSALSYTQTDKSDYSAIALTPKLSVSYLAFPPYWDIGISGYMTGYNISRNLTEQEMRFLGVNFRVGYSWTAVPSPWKVSLHGGYYYVTSFSRDESLGGFQNLSGPQVFPSVRYLFKNGQSVSGYFKFSPVSSSLNPWSFKSHELAGGAAYAFPLPSHGEGRSISVSLDAARLKLHDPASGTTGATQSITLGVGYGF